MNPNVLIAAIAAGGTIAVAITALFLNYRGFNSLERRLEVIETDLTRISHRGVGRAGL